MKTINLADFKGTDDRTRFAAALEVLRENPGSTLIVPPGVYNITTELSRDNQARCMSGEWGWNPEPVMFTPEYKYDRGLDFAGHKGSSVIAPEGATLMIDGFMEPISIRDCEGVTVSGFTVDYKRKPYTKAILTYGGTEIINVDGEDKEFIVYNGYCPEAINKNMPRPRSCFYYNTARRFEIHQHVQDVRIIDDHHLQIIAGHTPGGISDEAEREYYIWHTFHSRPVILIERAKDTLVTDVTIHASNGMGVTAMHADNIVIERLRVVPSVGEHMSTNTDATHFASCRGLLRLDGCEFDGQGDDTLNVHTYYYTPERLDTRKVRLRVDAPTGTHTQSVDRPEVGDRLELVNFGTLLPEKVYKTLSVTVDYEGRFCDVEVDSDLPESFEGYLICDPDAVPDVEFVNSHANNHWARSILIKSRRALIENCTVTDVFDVAVKVAAEAWWKEGINMEDVTIRKCRFVSNGHYNGKCGGISVTMDTDEPGSLPQGKVTITDNIIEAPYSEFAVEVRRTREAVILRNELSSKGECPIRIEAPETKITTDAEYVR